LWGQMQLVASLFSHRQANQTARVTGHEVDDFRRDLFGRANQIAFVLAVLVVHDNDHSPFANVISSVWNGCECHVSDFRFSDLRFLIGKYVTAKMRDFATQGQPKRCIILFGSFISLRGFARNYSPGASSRKAVEQKPKRRKRS